MPIPTRLYWAQDAGLAVHAGVSVVLRQPPALPGLTDLAEIDFAPGVVAQVRTGAGRARDLEPSERAACMLILKRVSFAARAAYLEPIGPDLKP